MPSNYCFLALGAVSPENTDDMLYSVEGVCGCRMHRREGPTLDPPGNAELVGSDVLMFCDHDVFLRDGAFEHPVRQKSTCSLRRYSGYAAPGAQQLVTVKERYVDLRISVPQTTWYKYIHRLEERGGSNHRKAQPSRRGNSRNLSANLAPLERVLQSASI